MNHKSSIVKYFRLIRFQTAAVTALTPVIGGMVMGQRNVFLLLILFFIGLLYHIYGFVLNEYIDIEIDKKSLDLKEKPLVSGAITKNTSLFIVLSACFSAIILTILFFPYVVTIALLLAAILSGAVYDIFGKKVLGSDFILAFGFFSLCLMGASTTSNDFTSLVYLVSSIYFVHIVFNNAVEGGIKDIIHDSIAGAQTLAIRLGVQVSNKKLKVTKKFIFFAVSIKCVFMVLFVLLWIHPEVTILSLYWYILLIVVSIFLILLMFSSIYKFLYTTKFDRSVLKKMFSVHEISSYSLLVISLSPLIGSWAVVSLILLPLVWYITSNMLLYEKFLEPQV